MIKRLVTALSISSLISVGLAAPAAAHVAACSITTPVLPVVFRGTMLGSTHITCDPTIFDAEHGLFKATAIVEIQYLAQINWMLPDAWRSIPPRGSNSIYRGVGTVVPTQIICANGRHNYRIASAMRLTGRDGRVTTFTKKGPKTTLTTCGR